MLPVSAACVVANGARETLSMLLNAPVTLRLFEPVIPTPRGWRAILRDARCYRIRSSVADAAIVLRAGDAIAFAAALFGEPRATDERRALSPIECELLDRMVNAIAANLAAVCGAREGNAERVAEIGGFVTYFELSLEEPLNARLGIALSREPSPETGNRIGIAQLSAVTLAACSSLELGVVQAASIAHLEVGASIAIEAGWLSRGRLTLEGQILARGTCGVRNGRYALAIDSPPDGVSVRGHGI
ncbi:MAG TPA: hypothetical protein VEW74_00785 [Candidatus Nitrosotalea sp.]|nr:hypothetical protein [Candidatus Nitrosotalea sp.]